MWVALYVGKGVVFAVHRDPFFGFDAGAKPNNGSKNQSGHWPYGQGSVTKCSVQVDRRTAISCSTDDETDD